MPLPPPEDAAPTGRAARLQDHSVPVFDGTRSHYHVRRGLLRLRAEATWASWRYRAALAGAETFVQFAGWPRSGHSLVGALIDAHPQAAVAHELDAIGLFRKGVPAHRLPAMCLANAAAFTGAGRHWNGFCYAVPEAPHGPGRHLRVVGDKKGDWATRWSAADPSLLDRLQAGASLDCRWILVTRHPADNIATMSLRRGGGYDRLRIAARGGDEGAALRAAQSEGRIAAEVDDAMIADYRALAAATAAMKARVPAGNWHEIVYERFTAAPKAELARLAGFLGLSPDPGWEERAAAIVRPSTRRSRDGVSWRDDQRGLVARTVAEHGFLSPYEGDV